MSIKTPSLTSLLLIFIVLNYLAKCLNTRYKKCIIKTFPWQVLMIHFIFILVFRKLDIHYFFFPKVTLLKYSSIQRLIKPRAEETADSRTLARFPLN